MKLYVARHGKTDVPLTDEGRAQAHVLAEKAMNCGITRIIASPLQRAQETAQIAAEACRAPVETEEEVGLKFSPGDARHLFSRVRKTINGKIFNDILDVWLFTYDGPVSLENATTDEVCDLKWMTGREIRALFDAGELVPTLGYFFTDVAGR